MFKKIYRKLKCKQEKNVHLVHIKIHLLTRVRFIYIFFLVEKSSPPKLIIDKKRKIGTKYCLGAFKVRSTASWGGI